MRLFFLLLIFAVAGCGEHRKSSRVDQPTDPAPKPPSPPPETSETPEPTETTGNEDPEESLPPPLFDPESLQLSDKGAFRAKFTWTNGPQVGESEGVLTIVDAEGFQAKSLERLDVKPWMKIHGHGTGRILPEVTQGSAPYEWNVTNTYFIMSGPRELNVTATVNGSKDTMEVKVEVP